MSKTALQLAKTALQLGILLPAPFRQISTFSQQDCQRLLTYVCDKSQRKAQHNSWLQYYNILIPGTSTPAEFPTSCEVQVSVTMLLLLRPLRKLSLDPTSELILAPLPWALADNCREPLHENPSVFAGMPAHIYSNLEANLSHLEFTAREMLWTMTEITYIA